MRILCLFSTDAMPWVIARHWLKALTEDGTEVCVACPPGPYVTQLRDFGFGVREVYVSRNLNPFNILHAVRSVHLALMMERWDVLNCHGAAAGLVGRMASTGVHPKPIEIITNHGYYFDENMHPATKWLAILTERLLAPQTVFTMFVSSEDHRTALKEGIITDPSRAAVILNGIDLKLFPGKPPAKAVWEARAHLGIPPDAQVIGLVGRLIIEKGLREFFQAARKLCAEHPNLYVVVAGDALPTDRGAWKTQFIEHVKAAGLTEKFRFPGFITDVYGCLCAFDILVHPTYKESFGRVIAEAMATELPVVATDVRGCRELVVHNETGLLVPYQSIEALVEAISALLENEGLRRSLGCAGRERVVKYYDQQIVIGKFVKHVRAVMDKRRGLQE